MDGVNVLRFPRLVPGFVMQLDPASPARIFGDFDVRVRLLERFLERESITDPILWVYHPGYGNKVLDLPHRLAVYDCVDDYAEFPMYRESRAGYSVARRSSAEARTWCSRRASDCSKPSAGTIRKTPTSFTTSATPRTSALLTTIERRSRRSSLGCRSRSSVSSVPCRRTS